MREAVPETRVNRVARLPPPVSAGDRVGVAALSGPVSEPLLEAGVGALKDLGFEPVLADNLLSRHRDVFAGSEEKRLAGFHRLAADASVRAIFFARGGHGVMRLLSGLDWPLLRRHPRAYVGYSDLTPFLHQVVERLGLVAFHGPLVAAELARGLTTAERDSLLGWLAGRQTEGMPITVRLRPGRATSRGPLLGGCLSLLVSMLGTEFSPILDDAWVFLEDVNEPVYRLDRMLTQLSLSQPGDSILGLALGHFEASEATQGCLEAWLPLVLETATQRGWGVVTGLDAGHATPNLTLPLGLSSELDCDTGRFVLGS